MKLNFQAQIVQELVSKKGGEFLLSANIGNRIKEERIKKGLTQNELGKIVGCSGVAIMRYEKDASAKDHREPSLNMIEALAEAFDITPFQLLGAEYFDMKFPEIKKEVDEYEGFIKYLSSLGYSVKEIPELSLIASENISDEAKKECNKDGYLEGESYTFTISKGKAIKVTLEELDFQQFQETIKKAVEFELFQRKQK